MKPTYALLILGSTLVLAVQARAKTILPDACGDDSVKFNVKTEKNQPAPAPPPAGKAQIVIINNAGFARYGIDGAWVGANDGNSYFAVTIDPGERHLCVKYNISAMYPGRVKQETAMVASVTAEAGKVYYFQSSQGASGGGGGGGYVAPTMGANGLSGGGMVHGGGGGMPVFGFGRLDDDTGKYRVKAWKLATWKSK
jgi:uncharacterized membrane protein YgcG